jgi:tetratricopeptide (TPR) repeat protein
MLAQQAGEYEKSIRLIERALALDPDDPDTLNSLGVSYSGQGDVQQANRCFRRLVDLRPESAEAYHQFGKTQERMGEWEDAAKSYQKALTLRPDSPAFYGSVARLKCKQGAFAEGAESCRAALALEPGNHELHVQLANALTDAGDFGAAARALQQALALEPDSAAAVCALGYFFERQGDLRSAIDAYRNALTLDPKFGSAYFHLGIIHQLEGDLTKARRCCFLLQQLEPDSADARSLLGLIDLQEGNFREGWGKYEDRWNTLYGFRFRRKLLQPLWRGEALEGSRILLHAEQGLGDTLQFVRYVPLVAARGAQVCLEVQPRLYRLLAQTPGAAQVIRRGEPLPEVDWQCPLLSLPLALRTELHTIPTGVPYLHADPAQVAAWSERLAKDSLRVGLVWAGSPLHPNERWRALPFELLTPLLGVPGVRFYSLQMGAPAAVAKQAGSRLIDLQDAQTDFADTAAIVTSLDLVISVDTSVAHLAGALGRPVWVLLGKSPDWRWLLERTDSPWYPTARLFRQPTLGNWPDVMTRVEQELRAATREPNK